MINRGLTLVFFLLCVFISPTQGQFAEIKDRAGFNQKFSESSKNTQTIEATFTQEKNLSVLSEKIISRGNFLFKKENKLRWEYTDPFRYLILLNNGIMVIQDEDKKSKVDIRNNKMLTEINSIIIGCVQGNIFRDEKKFRSSIYESSNSYMVKLKPLDRALSEYLSEIRIFFNKNTLAVSRLEIHEPSGDYTRIDFSGIKINTMIPDAKFLAP
jgi:outer membrane lipoprotein-sorting protein